MPRRLYYAITDGIRVTVEPRFVAEQSRPSMGHYVFAYRVRLENVGERSAQLLARRWLIHDDIGHDSEVAGEGVVGEQPSEQRHLRALSVVIGFFGELALGLGE